MLINPKKIIENGVLENQHKDGVQQNSIDLTVASIGIIQSGGAIFKEGRQTPKVLPLKGKMFKLSPQFCYAVEFNEYVRVPEDMAAFIICRSTLNRCGAFITSGIYDSGFENHVGAVLRTQTKIKIEEGARIATIYFVRAESASLYNGIYKAK